MSPGVAGAAALRFGVARGKKRPRESPQTLLIFRRRQVSGLRPARDAVPLATLGVERGQGSVMEFVGVHGSLLQPLRPVELLLASRTVTLAAEARGVDAM